MTRYVRSLSIPLMLLLACSILSLPLAAQSQSQSPTITDSPMYFLGSGLGFKPYQTTIKDGSSGYISGAVRNMAGVYTFARIVFHSSYAELVPEECKQVLNSGAYRAFACGGVGLGVNQDNVGVMYSGGGKLFYRVSRPGPLENSLLALEMDVDKSTVPAPVTPTSRSSPVQPAFRVGIYKSFN